ncbi:hypothetical protein HMPREF0497_1374 [Lentilactobacillus buchneri ATCC 11577]|nr:hypothetical protein HMPREF0497_1374 [Lentilactobacillus buchneri ATCC 11577]
MRVNSVNAVNSFLFVKKIELYRPLRGQSLEQHYRPVTNW